MTNSEHLTITLTGRPPVKIKKADWPIIAEATDSDHDGQVECQANRTWKWALRVRAGEGQSVVYGSYSYDTHFQSENCQSIRGGRLIDEGDDIPQAIMDVARELDERITDDGSRRFRELAHDCIADLPADDLTDGDTEQQVARCNAIMLLSMRFMQKALADDPGLAERAGLNVTSEEIDIICDTLAE